LRGPGDRRVVVQDINFLWSRFTWNHIQATVPWWWIRSHLPAWMAAAAPLGWPAARSPRLPLTTHTLDVSRETSCRVGDERRLRRPAVQG